MKGKHVGLSHENALFLISTAHLCQLYKSQREGNLFIYGIFLPSFLWSVTLGHRCVLSTLFPLAYHNRSEHSTGCSLSVHPKTLTVPQFPQIFQQLIISQCNPLTSCVSLCTNCTFNVLNKEIIGITESEVQGCFHAMDTNLCFKHC